MHYPCCLLWLSDSLHSLKFCHIFGVACAPTFKPSAVLLHEPLLQNCCNVVALQPFLQHAKGVLCTHVAYLLHCQLQGKICVALLHCLGNATCNSSLLDASFILCFCNPSRNSGLINAEFIRNISHTHVVTVHIDCQLKIFIFHVFKAPF